MAIKRGHGLVRERVLRITMRVLVSSPRYHESDISHYSQRSRVERTKLQSMRTDQGPSTHQSVRPDGPQSGRWRRLAAAAPLALSLNLRATWLGAAAAAKATASESTVTLRLRVTYSGWRLAGRRATGPWPWARAAWHCQFRRPRPLRHCSGTGSLKLSFQVPSQSFK